MITIEKIKIEFPKWWQTGLIIIAIILIAIIAVKAEPDTLIMLLQKIWKFFH